MLIVPFNNMWTLSENHSESKGIWLNWVKRSRSYAVIGSFRSTLLISVLSVTRHRNYDWCQKTYIFGGRFEVQNSLVIERCSNFLVIYWTLCFNLFCELLRFLDSRLRAICTVDNHIKSSQYFSCLDGWHTARRICTINIKNITRGEKVRLDEITLL